MPGPAGLSARVARRGLGRGRAVTPLGHLRFEHWPLKGPPIETGNIEFRRQIGNPQDLDRLPLTTPPFDKGVRARRRDADAARTVSPEEEARAAAFLRRMMQDALRR